MVVAEDAAHRGELVGAAADFAAMTVRGCRPSSTLTSDLPVGYVSARVDNRVEKDIPRFPAAGR